MNIGTISAKIVADVSNFNKGIADAQSRLEKAGQSFKQIGDGMARVGGQLTTKVTLPMMALGGAAIKTGIEFNTSMTKLRTQIGLSADEVDYLRESVLKLSPEVGIGARELGEAIYFIASAGFRGSEAMDILKYSAQASALGLGDTQVVARLLTSAVNAYGIESLDAAEATDILLRAVKLGTLEASEYADAMGTLLPVASNMGVEFHEVAAALAAMSKTGTDANIGATSLKNIMTTILKPTAEAKTALGEYGFTVGDLQKQLTEDGLIATLMSLKDAFGDNEVGMEAIFGNVRGLTGVFDLLGNNLEDNIRIFDEMSESGGDVDEAFTELQETTEFKLKQALARVEVAAVELADTLSPYVTRAIEWLNEKIQELIKWWQSLTEEEQRKKLQWAGLIMAAGPVLIILSHLFKGIYYIIEIIRVAILVIKTVGAVFSAVFAGVGATTLAVKGLIVGMILAIIYLFWEWIKMLPELFKALKIYWGEILKYLDQNYERFYNAIIGPLRAAAKVWGIIVGTMRQQLENLNPLLRRSPSLVDNVKKGVGLMLDEYSKLGGMQFQPVSHMQNVSRGSDMINLRIDMSGANISSLEIAEDYAEKMGNAIVNRLRSSRRSYA